MNRKFQKTLKSIALCMAALPFLWLCGCESAIFSSDSRADESSAEPEKAERFDTVQFKRQAEALQAIWKDEGQKEAIEDAIESMLTAVDEAFAFQIRSEIRYDTHWNNPLLLKKQKECKEDYYIAAGIAEWAFSNGYQDSVFPELFEPYILEENLDYYTSHTLPRIIAYSKQDAGENSDILNAYYDTAYDENLQPDEANLKCAELYLDVLEQYDTSAYMFDYYSRDYTVEEASETYQRIREQIVPLFSSALEHFISKMSEQSYDFDFDAYAQLKTYAPKLSPEIAESAQKLFDESLYTAASGENCFDGSFTVNLPDEQTALMYTYLNGDPFDFLTVTHEFGHFHSDWRDRTPIFCQSQNLDLSEAQALSMSVLFTEHYDDIFGEQGEFFRDALILDTFSALIDGFAVGEFEYQVMQQIDSITPEQVVELFRKIADENNVSADLYQITHLYENPGYYLSYGVSAFPALELFSIVQNDPAHASEMYRKLSSVASCTPDVSFRQIIKECGFSDVFDPVSTDALCDILTAFQDEKTTEE